MPGMALRQFTALPLGLLRSGWHSPALPSVSSALMVGRRSPERGESGRDRCLGVGSGRAAEKVSQGGFTSQVSSSKTQELPVSRRRQPVPTGNSKSEGEDRTLALGRFQSQGRDFSVLREPSALWRRHSACPQTRDCV